VKLQDILDKAVAAGHAPGLCAGVVTRDGEPVLARAGVRGVEDPAPMTADALFTIASCSKAVTSVAAMQLVERGLIGLDEPVGRHLPLLENPRVLTGFDADGAAITRPARGAITLRHLLTHTSGHAYDFTSADMARYLTANGIVMMSESEPDAPLLFDPGSAWHYGTGIDWAARLVQAVSGKRFDTFVRDNILAPLAMTDTVYFPDAEQSARKAGVQIKTAPGAFAAMPMAMPSTPHFYMGGAGLYSTICDYLKFLHMLLLHGAPLLQRETFDLMMQNHIGALDAGPFRSANPILSRDFEPLSGIARGHGLAGLLNLERVPGGRGAGSTAWAGIANCYYWADPSAGVAGALMAQVLPFADPDIMATFDEIERTAYA
jgi:methyl acetate hydrolase